MGYQSTPAMFATARTLSTILLSSFVGFAAARVPRPAIQNTGGSIAIEEAWSFPAFITQLSNTTAPPLGVSLQQLKDNLLDIGVQRLSGMDANNIDFMVLSCNQPCIQGIADPDMAASMAIAVNDQLAADIANNTDRFGAFASLAMHNATVAAMELNRTVTSLGFLGAILNDYQESGDNGTTPLYFDSAAYDPFWQMVQDLNVPVYFHPRTDIPTILNFQYAHAHFLVGPAEQFTATLAGHVLGIIGNGVFDRFPNVSIIVGHMGERIPSDLVRIQSQLVKQIPLNALPMKQDLLFYWQNNVFETCSGNFAPELLTFHASQIGLDRILYSIDYPFENMADGTTFLNGLVPDGVLTQPQFNFFARGLAEQLLHLTDDA